MGNVTQSKAVITDTLNNLASAVAGQMSQLGLSDVTTYFVKDVPSVKSTIEVQFGHTTTHQQSMVVQVDIYDDNNIKVLMPEVMAQQLGMPNLKACASLNEALQFVTVLAQRMRQS
jgi:hypothetical protein